MKLQILKGSADVTLYVFVPDSASTTGAGKTGIAHNAAGLVASYVRPLGSRTAITLATQTVTGAHSDGGWVEVDATNMPGVYRLDLPDAVCASGVNSVVVFLHGASGMAPVVLEIMLTAVNPQDAVRAGLTALPNAAADAAGGLPISDAGGLDLDARLDAAITSRLAPTTAGRTLDVSVGGEAGVDWANVGSPTTVVGLSGTTVKTATDVETDTADIQSRIPAALGANGNIKADLRDSIGVAVTSASGRPEVNTTHLAGTAYATAAAALVQAVWDAATSALTAVGSIGKKLADWVVGTIDTYTGNTKQTGDAFARIGAAGAGLTALGDSRIANLDATVSSRGTGTALTAADVRTALGLAAANLDTQLDALPTNAELATALAAADDAVLAAIAALNNLSQANVRTALGMASANLDTQLDALPTAAENAAAVVAETITELASVPGASPTLKQALALLYMALRNKVLSGASLRIHNDAGTVIATKVQTDNGTSYQEDKAT